MIDPAAKIMRFMETLDRSALEDAFAPDNVTILDSFPPYVFRGDNAVSAWANGFINHAKNLAELSHTFGEPQEFSSSGQTAFFSLPVTWKGMSNGEPFLETGGLALMVVSMNNKWYIQNYGWAVTTYTSG